MLREANNEPPHSTANSAAVADKAPNSSLANIPLDVTFRYDHTTNTYPRSVSREGKQFDAADKQRIAPRNVIVMVVRFSPVPRSKLLDADLIGTGKAYISTNGRTIEGTWKKTGTTEPTLFFDKAGAPATLTIGQTFVQVVRTGSPVTIKAGTATP